MAKIIILQHDLIPWVRAVAFSFFLGTIVSVTRAQPGPDWLPVDQNVADVDGLSISLRQVQVGINHNGEQTSLFEVQRPVVEGGPMESTFYRLGPGFRARVKRMDYLVPLPSKRRWEVNVPAEIDGMFLDFPAADAVWELTPEPDLPTTMPMTLSPSLVDGRRYGQVETAAMEGRVDGRVEGRIDGRVESRFESPAPSQVSPLGDY